MHELAVGLHVGTLPKPLSLIDVNFDHKSSIVIAQRGRIIQQQDAWLFHFNIQTELLRTLDT